MRFRLRHSEPKQIETKPAQYEVAELALKYGLSIFEARRILREAGESREKAEVSAEKAKQR